MRLTYVELALLMALAARPVLADSFSAMRMDTWQLGDEQTSILYSPMTGELGVDAPAGRELTSINIDSASCIFTGDRAQNLDGSFDNDSDCNIFKATYGSSFGSISFGNVAAPGLNQWFVADDLTVVGSLEGGGGLGDVDCCNLQPIPIFPGDANLDLSFDQQDIAQVLSRGKYLTGDAATWGEGDWNGAATVPYGYPHPPRGDGIFDQLDIVVALQRGVFLTGPYLATGPNQHSASFPALAGPGTLGDEQSSLVYDVSSGELDAPASTNLTSINIDSASGLFRTANIDRRVAGPTYSAIAPWGTYWGDDDAVTIWYSPGTGEVSIETSSGRELTSINIDSASGIFTGDPPDNLGGSFDTSSEHNIFKATFGGSFGSLSFGNVAQVGLSNAFCINDLTVIGSWAGGGQIEKVQGCYIPEPSTFVLAAFGLLSYIVFGRREAEVIRKVHLFGGVHHATAIHRSGVASGSHGGADVCGEL